MHNRTDLLPFSKSTFFHTTRRGNKDLKPETSNSFELAYLTSFRNFFIQAIGYIGSYNGTITRYNTQSTNPDGTPFAYWTFKNGKTFNARGFELEIKYDNPKIINTFATFTLIDGDSSDIDQTGHYNFKYIPTYKGAVGVHKNIGAISTALLLNAWSRTEGPIRSVRPQYYFDLNVGYSHQLAAVSIHHSLYVKNVLDNEVLFPEYADRSSNSRLNAIPTEWGYGRKFGYMVSVLF